MSTIVQRTAFTVVCGVERNFRMPKTKKKAFAVGLLREMLAEQGVEIDEARLRKELEWAYWKRKMRSLCSFCPMLNILWSLFKGFSGGEPIQRRLVHKLT